MKKIKPASDFFTLNLVDAILPSAWPKDVPLILKMQSGQHKKDYDILPSSEEWYKSLLQFVQKKNSSTDVSLPIGLNNNSLIPGSKVYDSNNNIVAQGKSLNTHLNEIEVEKNKLETLLVPLRIKFPKIKDSFLIDFDQNQDYLLKNNRPFKNPIIAYDVFCDIFISGNGSSYKDGSIAFLGAYNSIIDFNSLQNTIDLFTNEELKIISIASEQISYLTPVHSVINTHIKSKIDVIDSKNNNSKIKFK